MLSCIDGQRKHWERDVTLHISFTPKHLARDLVLEKNPYFSHFNVSQRRITSSKLLSSHGFASFPLSTPYLLFPMKGRVICQCDRWQPGVPDHVSLLGRVNCTWHVLLSPGLSVLSALILCSKLYALGRSERQSFIFSSLCDYWACKPGLQAFMQLVGLRHAKLIFINWFFLADGSLDFLLQKKNVPCVFYSFTINKVHTLILIWFLYGWGENVDIEISFPKV